MASTADLSPRDLEQLSAYLDGQLSPRQAARLEKRLRQEPQLRRAYKELRATVQTLATLPEQPLPRNFTLSPEMVGRRRAFPAYTALRFATVVVSFAFVVLVGLDALSAAAPAALRSMVPAVEFEQAAPAEERFGAGQEATAAAPADLLGAGEAEAIEITPTAAEAQQAFGQQAPETEESAKAAEAESGAELPAATATLEAAPPAVAAAPLTEVAPEAPSIEEGVAEDQANVPLEGPSPRELEATPSGIPAPYLIVRRALEIGLGLLALSLAAATLWVRRSSR